MVPIRKIILILLTMIVLIISYGIFNILSVLELFKEYKLTNYDKCLRISGAVGIEDLFEYKNILIGGSDDRLKLWELPAYGPDLTPNGSLVIIDPINYKLIKKPIKYFPNDIAFHPHGIYIYNNLLYTNNHAYNKGGERIEVIEIIGDNINNIEFIYKKSLLLPNNLTGISNDIAVIGDNDELYLTSYLPISDPINGRKKRSFSIGIVEKLCIMFNIRLTYIYHCRLNSNAGDMIQAEILSCQEIPETKSLMNNGIAFDYVDKLYVANPLEKRIRVYQINYDDMNHLKFVKDIDIGFGADNVYFSNKTKELYLGVLGQNYHHLALIRDSLRHNELPKKHSYKFGALQIDTKDNDKIKILTMFSNQMLGVSSAIKLNDTVFISSWADDGIQLCKIEE